MACQCLTVITLRQSNRGQYFLSFSYLASPIAWKSTSTKDQVSQYTLRIQTDDLVLSFRMFSNNYNKMRKRSNQTNGLVKANIEKEPSILRTLQWKWTDSKELKEINIMVRNRAIKILFKNSSVDDNYIQWYHNLIYRCFEHNFSLQFMQVTTLDVNLPKIWTYSYQIRTLSWCAQFLFCSQTGIICRRTNFGYIVHGNFSLLTR